MTSAAFHPSAVLEFRAAAKYYDAAVQGLGDQFIDEVERLVTLLCERPRLGSRVDAMHRRVYLRRFPFALVFRLDGQELTIIAVARRRAFAPRTPRYRALGAARRPRARVEPAVGPFFGPVV